MQSIRRYCSYISLLFICLFLGNIANASDKQSSYTIPNSKLSAKIDGDLSDPIWQEAKVITLDIVNNPWNNVESPVKTEARIVENGENIFISFVALDDNPKRIKAFLGDRDSRWGDDIVGIKLDTYNTRRLNYEFFVNPFGVQHDGINNEMTGEVNRAWNGIWDSYGKLTNKGFEVEIAIPYSILNFENSNKDKTWAFELVRMYPRDSRLRISHMPLDRNNDCWLCQAPEITGFKDAKGGKNLILAPALVATRDQKRDIYQPNSDWASTNDTELGLDLRWNINSNTLLNATINPDFSTIEADAGQLSVNKTYSLFYQEQRPFFLDNADYFTSNLDLVYTRNIADPEFGAKLTGTEGHHSYGVFVARDKETNFVVPGNTGSEVAALNTESDSAAMRYRHDVNYDLSFGAIGTFRQAENYHNYVMGVDTKYKLDESNTFKAQVLSSDTKYPKDLYRSFCYGESQDACDKPASVECMFGDCAFTEQVHRTNKKESFSDQAYVASYEHNSEFWEIVAEHKSIGENFRADLGFITNTDVSSNLIQVDRYFYGDEKSPWQEMELSAQWSIKHNENGELIEKSLESSFSIDGPMQSYLDLTINYDDKIGLRQDDSTLNIDGNTTLFTEKFATLYTSIEPNAKIALESEIIIGKKIDYRNNRLGDYKEFFAGAEYSVNQHLLTKFYYTHAKLEANGREVYTAKLSELRVAYQFDVQSYLKLSVIYQDLDRNPDNNPFLNVSKKNDSLSTQLIYAYKLNPQTVFYLGYSDSSYQDDNLNRLEREQRTFFTKISYAWMP